MSSKALAQQSMIVSESHPLPAEFHPNIDHIVTEDGEDTTKLAGYAKLGITYYIIYDPDLRLGATPLRVYLLERGRYELDNSKLPFFTPLGLGVQIWEGTYEDMSQSWLRWTTADGQLLPTGKERAIAEKQRADSEKQRADAEKHRADDAQREMERLRAKLKQLEDE